MRSCFTCGGSCRWSRRTATPSNWPPGKPARPTSTATRAITRPSFRAARRPRRACSSTTPRARSAWSAAGTWWCSTRSPTPTSPIPRPLCRSCRATCRTPSSAGARRKFWPSPPSSWSATSTSRPSCRTRSITTCSSRCRTSSRSRRSSTGSTAICLAGRSRRFTPARWPRTTASSPTTSARSCTSFAARTCWGR